MIKAVTSQIAAPFVKLKNRCLKVIMPTHVRRGFFITSLASYVLQQSQPDKILATQLVSQLDLPSDPKVFFVAMGDNKSYWNNLTSAFNCKENWDERAIANFVEEVVRVMPPWMLYSNTRLMRSDAIKTLRIARRYAQNA